MTALFQSPNLRFKVGGCYSSPIRKRYAIVLEVGRSTFGLGVIRFAFLNEHGTLGVATLTPDEFVARYFITESGDPPAKLSAYAATNPRESVNAALSQ